MSFVLPEQPEWMTDALCKEVGSELFFADDIPGTRYATRVCGRCEVRDDCLGYALDHNEVEGVWGGTTERQRGRIRGQIRRDLGLSPWAPIPAGARPKSAQAMRPAA